MLNNIGKILQGWLGLFMVMMFAIPIFTVSAIYNKLILIINIINSRIDVIYYRFVTTYKDKLEKIGIFMKCAIMILFSSMLVMPRYFIALGLKFTKLNSN